MAFLDEPWLIYFVREGQNTGTLAQAEIMVMMYLMAGGAGGHDEEDDDVDEEKDDEDVGDLDFCSQL